MRASPPFRISLTQFGVWRAAILGLIGLGVAVLAAWTMSREQPLWIAAVVAVAGLTIGWLGLSVSHVAPVELRWDGRIWSLGLPSQQPDEALHGELQVAIDIGPWMMLRFMPTAAGRARVVWLPAQRLGAASQWHALRCAVYAPRPVPHADMAAE